MDDRDTIGKGGSPGRAEEEEEVGWMSAKDYVAQEEILEGSEEWDVLFKVLRR